MSSLLCRTLPALAVLAAFSLPAFAGDIGDVAREMRLPPSVVEAVFANVDAYAQSPDAPANRLMTGTIKEVTLKAVRSRLGDLDDAGPGKGSEYSAEGANAVYKAVVRTTRRDSTEAGECVDNRATVTSSEALPAVKDGAFTFDSTHPRVTSYSWSMTFCRTRTSGGDFSDWSLAR